jgi:hypothetical protein
MWPRQKHDDDCLQSNDNPPSYPHPVRF